MILQKGTRSHTVASPLGRSLEPEGPREGRHQRRGEGEPAKAPASRALGGKTSELTPPPMSEHVTRIQRNSNIKNFYNTRPVLRRGQTRHPDQRRTDDEKKSQQS